jgi:predicted DNA-binding protein (MmcQ/YjbR family)
MKAPRPQAPLDTGKLKALCAALPGATIRLYGAPQNILVYAVEDKQFAYFKTSTPEQWRFSFRASPERFLELTDIPGIKPARYMARFHWVTVVDPASLPADYLQELVAWSHSKALSALGKARRERLLAAAPADPA